MLVGTYPRTNFMCQCFSSVLFLLILQQAIREFLYLPAYKGLTSFKATSAPPFQVMIRIRGSYGPQLAGCTFRLELLGVHWNSPVCMLDCSNPICWDGLIQIVKGWEQTLLPGQWAWECEGKCVVLQWFMDNSPDSLQSCICHHSYICLHFANITFRLLSKIAVIFGSLLDWHRQACYCSVPNNSPFWPNVIEWWKLEIIKLLYVLPTRRN